MIYLIGIGVEGRKSLTARALGLIGKAGLVAGGARHLEEFSDIKAKKVPIKGGIEGLADIIKRHAKKGGDTVVLATGDPLLFGIGTYIINKFGKSGVEVIPNVSTVQEAFARIKEDLNGLKILSAHGRSTDVRALCEEITRHGKVSLFTDSVNTPSVVAKALVEKGADDYRIFICESLGTGKERIIEGAPSAIARRKRFSPLNIMILIRDGAARKARINTGIPDDMFSHSNGMITKEEFRVISLSKMEITADGDVWDIGAGSGSVAIEAAMRTSGRVYAIEKDKKRVKDIVKNKKTFKAGNLEIISGAAPECLEICEGAPDSVFIGGGGAGIGDILSYVSKRIKRGGRVVVNAVTLETVSAAFEFLKRKGWERELIQVNLSKAKDIGKLNMLSANNPVFIISGKKP